MKFSLYSGKYRFLKFTPKHSINAFCTADDLFLFKVIDVFVSFMHLGNCFWNTSIISNCDNLQFLMFSTKVFGYSVSWCTTYIFWLCHSVEFTYSDCTKNYRNLEQFSQSVITLLDVILCIHEIQSQTNQTKK